MVAQIWTKPQAITAQLMVIAAWAVSYAQLPPTGSISGKLTDIHSIPIAGASVTLRNGATGFKARTTTIRGGVYRFDRLPAGEYSLTAENPSQGQGHVDGIIVAAAHESRIQTAMEFTPHSTAASEPNTQSFRVLEQFNREVGRLQRPELSLAYVDAAIATEALAAVRLDSRDLHFDEPGNSRQRSPEQQDNAGRLSSARRSKADSNIASIAEPKPVDAVFSPVINSHAAEVGSAMVAAGVGSLQYNILTYGARAKADVVAAMTNTASSASAITLTSEQLQALPLTGRNWENFVLDSPVEINSLSGEERPLLPAVNTRAAVNIDGVDVRLAFGVTGATQLRESGGSLIGPGATEIAISKIQLVDGNRSLPLQDAVAVETQRGTNHLHGQAFVFDRQNLLGAQNPLTRWVRETSPGSATAIPTFTAEPYSTEDKNLVWGIGIGGRIRKTQLFWFGSLDHYERNDPGVSTVKHPESFFAQPSNDQMQVLSARLGLSSADPVTAGVGAYSKMLETLAGLLGPAARSSSQWSGFGRIDWKMAERHSFTLEGAGAHFDSPGGGLTRASEAFGTHSYGSNRASETWLLGRWEAFITANLLAVTQGSFGRQIQGGPAEKPSSYEQTLDIGVLGQLPQIVVDPRYGFTIGNPARFGTGSYPDEHLYKAGEQVSWVRGRLMVKAGFDLSHNTDATGRLRNQTGTYYYSSAENFASDALSFAAFGINGQLDPMNQHNCDQTGKVWRDSAGDLHGLGYLPCYSYYSQMMGPAHWWLSTDDWAGYATAQLQPNKKLALSLALRWDREELPMPLSLLANPDLPLTQKLPSLGNGWGPRAGFAWGSGESHWPVLRGGYGVYFGRTQNAVIETALTQTGSFNGDLNFFMRPTDNLTAGGAPPFPYVLSGEPGTAVKPGAVEFASGFRNGEIQQGEVAVEESLPSRLRVEAAAVASLGRRLPVTLDANVDRDVNPKTITYAVVDANQSGPIKTQQITVPFYASWPFASSPTGFAGRLNPSYQQVSELFSRANSTYEAAMVRLMRSGRELTVFGRYTYAHAMDWNPNESAQVSGPSVLDPSDFRAEYGTSDLDVRHSASVALTWEPRWKLNSTAGHLANGWMLSGIGQFHSGLPYTMRTAGSLAKEFDAGGSAIIALATGMNGYGGDNRVYGVGRNTYRYTATWKADLRLGKRFDLGRMGELELLAESFNLFNHQNVTELETVGYSIQSGSIDGGLPTLNFLTGLKSGQTEFGQPLNVNATNFYRERQFQFGARVRF